MKYKSSGKKYNGEKAIISLTSWTGRIKNVSKTIFSLLKFCPGFHIVLVLSEEEFPKMEEELPEDLIVLVKNKVIELLWVYKNYKSFKKVLFTMDKYRKLPVISADDGQRYIDNFAEKLYQIWLNNKDSIISNTQFIFKGIKFGSGCRGLLYPPYCFKNNGISILNDTIINTNHDDAYIGLLAGIMNISWVFTNKKDVRIKNFRLFKDDEKVGLTINHKFDNKAFIQIFNTIKNEIQL